MIQTCIKRPIEKKRKEETNKRKMFSTTEDMKLRAMVLQLGINDWKKISEKMPNRTPRQCRERYKNYLAPEIQNGPWTREEDNALLMLYQKFGPRWSTISQFFRTRSEVNVKNRWTSIGRLLLESTPSSPTQLNKNSSNPIICCFHEQSSKKAPSNPCKDTLNNDFFTFDEDFSKIEPYYDVDWNW